MVALRLVALCTLEAVHRNFSSCACHDGMKAVIQGLSEEPHRHHVEVPWIQTHGSLKKVLRLTNRRKHPIIGFMGSRVMGLLGNGVLWFDWVVGLMLFVV